MMIMGLAGAPVLSKMDEERIIWIPVSTLISNILDSTHLISGPDILHLHELNLIG